jgi:hypothetical protein
LTSSTVTRTFDRDTQKPRVEDVERMRRVVVMEHRHDNSDVGIVVVD